jgi:menaquinone biosynthesis protein, SCO4550 family/putative menaquinone biosynthesis protein, SCO4494 family
MQTPTIDEKRFADLGLLDIARKVEAGQRLSIDDGRRLYACPDVTAVGALAHYRRFRLHGGKTFYVVNRHINYTNVCINGCAFCAYHREKGEEGGFELSIEQAVERLRSAPLPPREVHIVGGCHPDLRLAFFVDLLQSVQRALPQATLKCFTAVEIAHFAQLEGISTREVLQTLKNAGLAMMPGGGAEIFEPKVRRRICPKKSTAEEWLRIHGEAHELGLITNCTMLFGHLESIDDRLDHLDRLRTLQDESLAKGSVGFSCFVPLSFQTENSAIKVERPLTGVDELKTIAVSRLMLDNIEHIKSYWVMLTVKQAQAALFFGADDLDGTVVEEKIGHMAGATSAQGQTKSQLEAMIRGMGLTPVERDAHYNPVEAPKAEAKAQEDKAWTDAPSPAILQGLLDAAAAGARLDFDTARALYRHADLHALGHAAHLVRLRKHPEPIVTYVVDRNINYSNVCVCACRFCAYFRAPGDKDCFVLSHAEIGQKIEETIALGGTQILMQGGHHPDLPLEWYEDMLRFIKQNYPIHVHAFSPPEIVHFAKISGLSTAQVIERLRAAGLDSIPGGGAEILVDEVRGKVSPNKCPAGQWLAVMEEAHAQGLRTTATMMFGHEESEDDRLRHLFGVRESQDKTGGFTAFIPWTFQPENTAISARKLTSVEYLRLLALSRLVLDNVDNLQVSWVTMGPKIAQLALYFGGNDFGSTMIEENVVRAAGVSFRLSQAEIDALVRAAGFTPRQRRMNYTLMPLGEGAE